MNIQLGDTPVGQRPFYIITGQASAMENGSTLDADIDSVVTSYEVNGSGFERIRSSSAVPISATLDHEVAAGDRYRIRAVLHASVESGPVRETATAERVASGSAIDGSGT